MERVAHIFEGKLYIQTGKVKDVSKQLHANPKAEICAFKNGKWLRVAGELAPDDLSDVDLVVYGHSHKYADQLEKGVRWLNPGSCGPRRFNQDITMAVMELKKNAQGGCTYEIQRIDIDGILNRLK